MTQTSTPTRRAEASELAGDVAPTVHETADRPGAGGTQPDEAPRLDLSLTQLFAGALAAMTAAVIGARLGVAGTVVGAAIGSLVAGVAGAVYSVPLRHGRVRLRSIARVAASPRPEPSRDRGSSPRRRNAAPSVGRTRAASRARPWGLVLGSAAAAFVLGAVGITGLEMLAGGSVSGGTGTTIGQVSAAGPEPASLGGDTSVEDESADADALASQEQVAGEPTAEPTAEPTTEPIAEPSEQPSDGEGTLTEPGSTEAPIERPPGEATGPPSEDATDQPSQQPTTDPSQDPADPTASDRGPSETGTAPAEQGAAAAD